MTSNTGRTIWRLSDATVGSGPQPRLRNVSLTISEGVTAVVGPSGAGKTTLLNLLVGFERPTSGSVARGDAWPDHATSAPPVYWAPQDHGLWPHLSAQAHLQTVAPAGSEDRIRQLLEAMALDDCAHRLPEQLSQGERDRLAVARALATEAPVLVMDEPLVHVDPARSAQFWQVIRDDLQRANRSLVFATHMPQRVLAEAGAVVCLDAGRAVYSGGVEQLYWHPPSEELGRFLGEGNWFTAEEQHRWLALDDHAQQPIEAPAEAVTANSARRRAVQEDDRLSRRVAGSDRGRVAHQGATSGASRDAADSCAAPGGVSWQRDRPGRMIRPEQLQVHLCDRSTLVVESSFFQGVVSEVTLNHEPTGERRTVYHRPIGPTLRPGQRVLLRVLGCLLLMLMPLSLAGCGDNASAESTLNVVQIEHWTIPPKGPRVPAPRSLATGPNNETYVLDTAGRVLVYDAEGTCLRIWDMPEYTIGRPEGIVRLHDGRIAVADTHYNRVVYFDDHGKLLTTWGEFGREPGQFIYPVGITQDDDGNIYICEYGGNDRVQKFTVDGELIKTFGSPGVGPGEFQRPSGITWHDGKLYVADAINNRVQVFTDEGAYVGILNEMGDAPVELQFPYDLRMSPDGNLFIVEYRSARITKMDLKGNLVGRFGSVGIEQGKFITPWGVTVDHTGRVHVADTGNHRIVGLRL